MRPTTVLCLVLAGALPAQTPPCYADFTGPTYITNTTIIGGVILAIQLTSPNPLVITRAELHTGTKNGTSTMLIYAHDPTPNQPLNPPLAQGTFAEVAAIGWQGANLTTPAILPANTPFWLGWKPVGGELTPAEAMGATLPGIQTYRPSFDNGQTWTGPYKQFQYKIRLLCNGQVLGGVTAFGTGCKGSNQLAQNLSTSGTPTLGLGYTVSLANTAGVQPALLGLGLSATTWGGVPLPYPLAALNAPGCTIYTDFLVTFATASSAGGTAAIPLAVPSNAALLGSTHYHQWAVLDVAANGLGLVTSGAAKVLVGN